MSPPKFIRSNIVITFLSLLSVGINFISQMILAFYFGTGMERDSYFSAMTVPTYVVTLFVGSFTVMFLPFFVNFRKENGSQKVIEFVSSIFGLCVVSLSLIAILGFFFANKIVSFIAPGFSEARLLATSDLFSILIFTLIFQSLASFLSVFHHVENKFSLPAISPIITPITALLAVLFFNDYGIGSLAVGTLIGSILSMLIVLPKAAKQMQFALLFNFLNIDIKQFVKLTLPLMISGAIFRLTTVAERIFASELPTGSISYLAYGNQIYLLLVSLASGSIAATFYPIMSKAWAENHREVFSGYLDKGIKLILMLTLPIAAIFISLSAPIIKVLFQRGVFDSTATLAVANTLRILMMAFVLASMGTLLAKVFYITKKTVTISIISLIEILIYILSGYLLSNKYSYLGLAAALAISVGFGVIVSAFILIRERLLSSKDFRVDIIKLLVASFFCYLMATLMYAQLESLRTLYALIISVLISIVCYLLMSLYILRISDSEVIKKTVRGWLP